MDTTPPPPDAGHGMLSPRSPDSTEIDLVQWVEVDVRAADGPRPRLSVEPVIDAVYPDPSAAGRLGDLAVPWVRVRNTGNVAVSGVVLVDADGEDVAELGTLAPGDSVTAREREAVGHRLTAEDIARGEWSTWFLARGRFGHEVVSARGTMAPLALG